MASITPAILTANGGNPVQISITGSGFTDSSQVEVNGKVISTTYVSASQLQATIPASALVTGAQLSITVSNGAGSSTGASTPVGLTVNNPVPAVASVSPSSSIVGTASVPVQIKGTNFVPSSTLTLNGEAHGMSFISSTEVDATLSGSDLATAGTLALAVVSPTPGGGTASPVSFVVAEPAPQITSITPATAEAGSVALTVTLQGSGFVGSSQVLWNGVPIPSIVASAGVLSAMVPANLLAAVGTARITVSTPAPGGGLSSAVPFSVNSPSPTIATLNPSAVAVGTAVTVSLTGTGFMPSTTLTLGGASHPITVVSSTQATVALTASDLNVGGSVPVVVTNTAPGGGSSAPVALIVTNPAPVLTSVTPPSVLVGPAGLSIDLQGSAFVSTSTVLWNGSALPTTFVSGTELRAQVSPAQVATAGSVTLAVTTPVPGGGISATMNFDVDNPVPTLLRLDPDVVVSGASTPTTITLTGSNFLSGASVQMNGIPRATVYVSSNQLSFQLTTADQAAAANLSITVANPSSTGTSAPVILSVAQATATPVLSSVAPNSLVAFSPDTTIAVFGTSLTSHSVVQWNGIDLATVYTGCSVGYYFPACLQATVPAALLAAAGPVNVTVTSPTANPSISNALAVTVALPPVPTIASLTVNASPIRTAISIGVKGTGFVTTSSVLLNGLPVPTALVNSTELTANVPASSLATPGVLPITVATPGPGGGTSSAQYFTAYVAIPNNSMVYNPANGLFYLSVPSAAGPPYGNTVVSVDPLTGTTGKPIPVGSEPNRLAITSDGRYLWVALDGAAAVRQVDLTTGTAGLEFSIGPSGDFLNTVAALAALPGSPDSVVVSTYYGGYTEYTGVALTIYDRGVARPKAVTFATYAPFPWALLVNGATGEIYGPGSVFSPSDYITYSYDANGVTQKFSQNSSLTYAGPNTDDVQIVGNTLYTDFGQGVNAETGALLGTFFSSGTTVAQGAITVDSSLRKAFILEGSADAFDPSGSATASATLAAFNTADYSASSAPPLGVTIPLFQASYQYVGPTSSRLTRWGTDGLAFRGTGGFVSLRSSLVQDLSSLNADLAVSVIAPTTAPTGAQSSINATATNAGPSAASGVSLVLEVPSSEILVSAVPSAGSCATGTPIICNLGTLAHGANAKVAVAVVPVTPGNASVSAQVSASESDPVPSNNSASATTTVTGSAYNLSPTLASISPAGIASGSSDTQITINGTGFSAGTAVQLNGNTIQTSFASATQLTATVPAANLASLGWLDVTVSNPAPGGGTSASSPLYVFAVLSLNANHIVYDPYSRTIIAGVSAGTSNLAPNSLVEISPDSAAVGPSVPLGSTPAELAITSGGEFVYALLPNSTTGSIARFDLLARQVDLNLSGFQATGYNVGLRDLATLPGSPNALAVDEGEYPGTSIFDFDSQRKVATRRGAATGIYSGTCLTFPDPSRLFITDLYTSGVFLKSYNATANGLLNGTSPYYEGYDLLNMNCTKSDGNLLFGQSGGVADLSSPIPTQTGTFNGMPFITDYAVGVKDFAPDASLRRSFYLTSKNPNEYSSIFDSITGFDIATYMPTTVLTLPFSDFETSGFTGVDMVRWGQDGLAILSSGGNLYLVRGPVVVPALLGANTAATLTSSSSFTLTHGAGNTLLTLTGTNLQPGVAVTWNGSYCTTRLLNPTQVTVAVSATDLATTGIVTLVATNPGASASAALTVTVQ